MGERNLELSSPRIFTGCFGADDASLPKHFGVIVVSPSAASAARFAVNSLRKMLVKPRFRHAAMERHLAALQNRIMHHCANAFVSAGQFLPMPGPIPRPTRFLAQFAFLGVAVEGESWVSNGEVQMHDLHRMRNLGHHSSGWPRPAPLITWFKRVKLNP